MLLDATFLIDFERELSARRTGPARRFLGAHRNAPAWVPVVAFSEVAAGMASTAAAEYFFQRVGFRILPVSRAIGLRAAELEREMSGHRIGENDHWIAATALYYRVPVVSEDERFD